MRQKKNELLKILQENMNWYDNIEKIKNAVMICTGETVEGGTDHGIHHVERVIENISVIYRFFFSDDHRCASLNPYECFLLLAAAYLHDIGFYLNDADEVKNFYDRNCFGYGENQMDFIRKNHALLSAYWIDCNRERMSALSQVYFGDRRSGYYIAKIVKSHGLNFWESSDYQWERKVGTEKIREQYLCYLLCLADILDCDKRRNYGRRRLKEYLPDQRIFIRTHEYIEKICFRNDAIIVRFRWPRVRKELQKDFFEFYRDRPLKWIKILLDVGKKIFGREDNFISLEIQEQINDRVFEPSLMEYQLILKYNKLTE